MTKHIFQDVDAQSMRSVKSDKEKALAKAFDSAKRVQKMEKKKLDEQRARKAEEKDEAQPTKKQVSVDGRAAEAHQKQAAEARGSCRRDGQALPYGQARHYCGETGLLAVSCGQMFSEARALGARFPAADLLKMMFCTRCFALGHSSGPARGRNRNLPGRGSHTLDRCWNAWGSWNYQIANQPSNVVVEEVADDDEEKRQKPKRPEGPLPKHLLKPEQKQMPRRFRKQREKAKAEETMKDEMLEVLVEESEGEDDEKTALSPSREAQGPPLSKPKPKSSVTIIGAPSWRKADDAGRAARVIRAPARREEKE